MAGDQVVTLRLTANTQGLVTGVQIAKREFGGMGDAGESAGRRTSAAMNTATNSLRSYAAQAAAAFSVTKMVQMADQYANINARLKLVTGSEQAYAAAQAQTYAIAQRTFTGLESTATLYGRMQKSTESLGRSQADALRVTELINKTFQVSGTSAAAASGSIIQLAQGLSAGALRGDEFNSVLEGAPRLADALSASLGVNRGELRAMAEQGKLTAETIINALLDQGDAIDSEFSKLPVTVGRAWQQFENAALVAIGKVDALLGGSGSLAIGIQAITGFIEKIPRALEQWGDEMIRLQGVGDGFFADFLGNLDLISFQVGDVVSDIGDEFLILPTSLRTVATIIIGEFDQMMIGVGESFDLLVIAGEKAWVALKASAAGLAGELKLLIGGAIDRIIQIYADMISDLAAGASEIGLDSIASQLKQMSSELQGNANVQAEVREQVEATAAAYAVESSALDEAAASVQETAAAKRSASQVAVQAALDEREAALRQVSAQEDLAQASTATGTAIEGLTDATKENEKAQRAAAKADEARRDALRRLMEQQQRAADNEYFDSQINSEDAAIAAGRMVDALRAESEQVGLTQAELRRLAETRQFDAEMQAAQLARSPEQLAALRAEFDQAQATRDASEQAFVAAQRAAQDGQRAWTDFAGDLVDAMGHGMRGVKDLFGNMLKDLARQLLQSSILRLMASVFGGSMPGLANAASLGGGQSMLGAMLGGGGGGLANLFGTFTGGASGGTGTGLLGSIGSLGSMFTGIGSMFASIFNPGTVATVQTGIGAMSGMFGGAGFGVSAAAQTGATTGLLTGSGMSTAFAGIPIVGWIAAAVIANLNLARSGWASGGGSLQLPDGQNVRGGGLGGGAWHLNPSTAIDSIFRGLGLSNSVASILSGDAITNRLFGRKAPELTGSTTTVRLGGDEATGSVLYRILERGGVFRSDRRSTRTGALSTEAADSAQELYDSVRQVMVDSARALKGEAPAMLDAALRVVAEYDKKGKIKSTKYFVDILGRTWEESTEEAATQRIAAESMIATIDAILGTTVDAASNSIANAAGDVVGAGADAVSGAMQGASGAFDNLIKSAEGAQGEASAIAERWRDDAATLADGASMLLAAAVDIRNGNGLLGADGTLTQIADLIEELQAPGEALAATYQRVSTATALLTEAVGLMGVDLGKTREEFVRFGVDIVEAAGGLDRAQALWKSYFDSFYTEAERTQFAATQAQGRATTQFSDIGLNLNDYTGTGGMEAFRRLFEERLPTLSADAIVQWLEAGDALATFVDLSGQVGGAVTNLGDQLTELMDGVTQQLADYAPPPTFAERIAAITTSTDEMIRKATALGATEAQLAQIRELGAARLNEVLDEQGAAIANYQSIVQGVNDELADARGLSDFQREMRDINRWLSETTNSMNEAARAAGMQGAAEADLAAAHELAAIRAAAAIARLQERGRGVVEQLFGSPLEQLNQQIAQMEAGIGGFAGGVSGGMEQVTQATDNAVQAQLGAQQRIRDWLDNLMSSELGGLRPRDALVEAQALFDRTLAAAQGGDAEAMAALPQLADQLLRLGQRVYASGQPYFDLRDTIRSALEQIANMPHPDGPPVGGGIQGGNIGGYGGGGGGGGTPADLQALYEERERLLAQQSAAERRDLAIQLMGIVRDLVIATGDPLSEIAEQLGFSMTDLISAMGVNLTDLSVGTATQLADIAQAMGVNLTELASNVGVDLGSLGDRQSLLNDALEAEIGHLPQQQRDQLAPLLRRVEDAAALGDTAGVEDGISDMEDAINEMSPDIRDALAPYFAGIRPADPATELNHLSNISGGMTDAVSALHEHTGILNGILGAIGSMAGVLTPGGSLGGGGIGPQPPPGYAVGTPWVPNDTLAFIHAGEAIVPRDVNTWLRRMGSTRPAGWVKPGPVINPGGGARDDVAVAEMRARGNLSDDLLRQLLVRVERLETATREGAQRQAAAMDRQTDAMKGRR